MKILFITLMLILQGAGGHQLTSLWNQYDQASKADLPQKEAAILKQIKTEAAQKHLPEDFWDAATQYVNSVQRRDWKQRGQLRDNLQKEVEAFAEPIVTFHWMMDWGRESVDELLHYLQANPLKGNHPGLHRATESYLNGALDNYIGSDQEWALWRLWGRFSSEETRSAVKDALAKEIKGKYPQEGALKYYQISRQVLTREQKRSELQALGTEYAGKSLGLYPEGDLLEMEMEDLEEAKAGQDSYKALYDRCRAFESRRAAMKNDAIAKSYTGIENLIQRLTDKSLQISASRDTVTVLFRNLSKAKVTLYQDKNAVTTWNPVLEKSSFYVYDTLRLKLPEISDGAYSVEAVNGKITARTEYDKYTISIATRTDAGGIKVFAADYRTGVPLGTVKLLLMKGDAQVATATMSLDGFTRIPSALEKTIKAHPKVSYSVVAERGSRRSRPVSVIREKAEATLTSSLKCNIYRDRGAYNPGDTLKFKAVVYEGDPMLKMKVCKGKKLELQLSDAEGNIIGKQQFATNEWGSVSGSFAVPEGLRNGMFTLVAKSKDTILQWDNFRVDEFVLPTFDLTFDKRTELYLVGDSVPVSGKVVSYSGHGLSGARVRIKVSRWSDAVLEREAPLPADGSFRFDVPAASAGHYDAEVTVVDATGETLSFRDGFYVGNSLSINVKVLNAEDATTSVRGASVVSSPEIRTVFQAMDAGGNPVPLKVKYVLRQEIPGQAGHDGRTVQSGEETVIPVTGSGLYTITSTVEATLPSGEKIERRQETKVLVLLPGESAMPVKNARVFIAGPSTVDGRIQTLLGSSEGDAWVVASVFGKDSQLLEQNLVHVDDGTVQAIGYRYQDSWPDAVRLQLFYFIGGKAIKYDRQYRRERTRTSLPLEFSSFRDKAYPGTEYTFALKTRPGVEALAAAWDKSMDAIAPNYWSVVSQQDYSVPFVQTSSACGLEGRDASDWMPFYRVESRSMLKSANVAYDALDVEESAVVHSSGADEPVIRSVFLPALTFQPHLMSAKDGSLSFSFRTSDKLSTYYVRVYAHDKDMHNAVTEGEMLVTIPVKVSLLEPRYLYRGDVWEASVTVSSIADAPVSGVLSLSWADRSAQVPVEVPAGETVTRVFTVAVPDLSSTAPAGDLTLSASFRAPGFSDAVRVSVPVLPAAQILTESHSAVLLAGEDREALLEELRSRFVNVPGAEASLKEITVLDMVRDAMPSHVEPRGDDVLSLSEAWYVSVLSEGYILPGASALSFAEGSVSPTQLMQRILSCRNADGGFGWFEGMSSSPVITAVLLERMAKLRDRGFEVPDVTSSVKYLDSVQFAGSRPWWCGWLSDAQYMHVRALYASVPFTQKVSSAWKKTAKSYLTPSAREGRGLSGQILAKARRLLTLRNLLEREGGLNLAKAWGVTASRTRLLASLKADTASLLEYAVEHRDGGWYYPNAVMPWRGLLESEVYAHALLCELLSSAKNKADAPDGAYPPAFTVADGIRLWLMLQKETQKWGDDPAFVDAITAILDGSEEVLDTRVLALSAIYTKAFSDIKASGNGFTVERKFYRGGNELHPGESISVGDKITAVYRIWNAENRSFVKLTAGRQATLSPVQQLSGHTGFGFKRFSPQGYRNVKASVTEYYFDSYPEEDTEISEEFYVTRAGTFQAPAVVIESLYAPHNRANTPAAQLRVELSD